MPAGEEGSTKAQVWELSLGQARHVGLSIYIRWLGFHYRATSDSNRRNEFHLCTHEFWLVAGSVCRPR